MKKILLLLVLGCADPGIEVRRTSLVGDFVELDGTAASCEAEGWSWAEPSRTCRMTADLVNHGIKLVAGAAGMTLDLGGFTVCYLAMPASGTCYDSLGVGANNLVANGIWVTQDNVTVTNGRVFGFWHGVHAEAEAPGALLAGLVVKDLRISGSSAYSNADPNDGARFKAPDDGVYLVRVVGSLFEDLDIRKTGSEALAGMGVFRDNVIRRVIMKDNLEIGLLLGDFAAVASCTNNLVEDNFYERSELKRPEDANAYSMTISGSVFQRNRATKAPGTSGFSAGIALAAGTGNFLASNEVDGATLTGMTSGQTASNNLFYWNSVTASGGGLLTWAHVTATGTLVGNRFCSSATGTTLSGLMMTDVTTRVLVPGAPANFTGALNACGRTNACVWSGSSYTCSDYPAVSTYRDFNSPTRPCWNSCGP